MATQDVLKNEFGKDVKRGPHIIGSLTDANREDLLKLQDEVLARLDKYDLWRFFDKRGKMKRLYREYRLREPELEDALKDMINWKCLWGQRITNEDVINYEMASVFIGFIINTNSQPKTTRGMDPKDRRDLINGKSVRLQLHPSTGHPRAILRPGAGIAITLLGDDHMPRIGLTDGEGHVATKTVRYDHTDPIHNAALRSGGTYLNVDDLLGDVPVDEEDEDGPA